MDVPPEIAFRNVEPTPTIEDRIVEGIEKLEKVYDRLTSVRIMVEDPNPGRESGNLYHIRIDMGVPGSEIVVHRKPPPDPHEDVLQALGEAFDIARRRLKKWADRRRGDVKRHVSQPMGRVLRLFPGEGYGFIESQDGREIYFHQNSVVDGSFESLDVGTTVRFAEERGDKGPQASTVHVNE